MAARRRKGTSSPLVLLVDDVEDNRDVYAQFLEHHGYRVALAPNGEEAVALARNLKPDVVVMDLSMPRVDGWEATRRLKGDPATAAIPIVALTGHALDRSRQQAMEAGCDAYCVKPLLPAALEAEILRVLRDRAHPRAPRTDARLG